MANKMYVGLLSLALSITGLCVQKTGWFTALNQADAATSKRATVDPLTQAAARHARCQPLHWRALVLQPR